MPMDDRSAESSPDTSFMRLIVAADINVVNGRSRAGLPGTVVFEAKTNKLNN